MAQGTSSENGNNDNDDGDIYSLFLWGFNGLIYTKHLALCLALIRVSIDVRHYNYYVYVASKCS